MLFEYYLAYGSNLNLFQMSYRCKHAKKIGDTKLENYHLVYKGANDGYAYLTIEECEGSYVPIGIYKVSIFDIEKLDKYEGYPHFYSKVYMPVKIKGKTKNALIYIMNPEYDYHLPSINYVKTCYYGYRDFGFDKKMLSDALDTTFYNMLHTKKKTYKRNI